MKAKVNVTKKNTPTTLLPSNIWLPLRRSRSLLYIYMRACLFRACTIEHEKLSVKNVRRVASWIVVRVPISPILELGLKKSLLSPYMSHCWAGFTRRVRRLSVCMDGWQNHYIHISVSFETYSGLAGSTEKNYHVKMSRVVESLMASTCGRLATAVHEASTSGQKRGHFHTFRTPGKFMDGARSTNGID